MIKDTANRRWVGHVTAGPLLEPTAASTLVDCQLHRDTPNGSYVVGGWQQTPGPVGFYEDNWTVRDVSLGTDFYVCTSTAALPTATVTHRGCTFAFTAN